ncbi:hypothetical protein R3Q06_29975 [Rhodococcus erythropolis]|uniref:hypothetical protein n=1 Tax=Rhodococcus erythropolis TaxID=1833 RepID=UPI00294A24D3|nr:hypothetical protein [Rhodococcus erythropolis]MDV6277726.1 hypothetical protein [Rhodococcus erythropolis]
MAPNTEFFDDHANTVDHRAVVESVRSTRSFEIEWPAAVTISAGHLLATERHNHVLEEIGEALEGV